MPPYVLQENITPDDQSWKFHVPQEHLKPPRRHKNHGKLIKFTTQQTITLNMDQMPANRILNGDDPTKFILVSFSDLRFPDTPMRVTADYISRFLKAGLFLNNIQYRFYHHSNSQLVSVRFFLCFAKKRPELTTSPQRGRSCFLRQANTDAELDARIYGLGEFEKIMNVAKRSFFVDAASTLPMP
jgi:hypothetical protein